MHLALRALAVQTVNGGHRFLLPQPTTDAAHWRIEGVDGIALDFRRLMIDKFPKLRKLTINTTGLTPQRGIPMLTKVVEMCHERNVIFSTRVSIDGVNEMHGSVRNVRNAFDKAGKTAVYESHR